MGGGGGGCKRVGGVFFDETVKYRSLDSVCVSSLPAKCARTGKRSACTYMKRDSELRTRNESSKHEQRPAYVERDLHAREKKTV